jgi:hypothetical protein
MVLCAKDLPLENIPFGILCYAMDENIHFLALAQSMKAGALTLHKAC